ncbi:MAG: hypothetical protein CML02_20940 [Pseudooceanicola sp.]|nr:hypothetical protein [Pseudooceanicola sp.]|tara:strand:- start:1151 stop:2245 length:1095 start_codon:yes stop_codon:yes gene_type:complete
MHAYLVFSLLSIFALIFNKYLFVALVVVGISCFLFLLPSTGLDYYYYRQAFENAYLVQEFPWFKTDSIITAEPFYLWYNSFLGVVFPFGFPFFLVVNFLICFLLSYLAIRRVPKVDFGLFWAAILPVVVPTIFYFSPRSSVSFFLLLLSFFLVLQSRFKTAAIFMGGAFLVHSQYILVSAFIVLLNFFYPIVERSNGLSKKIYSASLIICLAVALKMIGLLLTHIEFILSLLPSANIAISKLRYFEGSSSGLRITAVLSVIVYPAMILLIGIQKQKGKLVYFESKGVDDRAQYFILMIIFFGAVINVVFFGDPHLAGRLSRFSDYLGLGVVMPMFFKLYFDRSLAVIFLWFLCFLGPILYPTVY